MVQAGERRDCPRIKGVFVISPPAASAAFAALLLSTSAFAQSAPPLVGPDQQTDAAAPPAPEHEAAANDLADDIVVVAAGKPRGSVISNIEPELVLNPADIRAYGASSLGDLITELSAQTSSGRGRGGEAPVVLLNGKRISGFSEIRNIPPEAIVRVEVLPEETSLSYGYRADQRVINIVLRERFRAVTAEGEVGGPVKGGQSDTELKTSLLRLDGDNRLLVDLSVEHSSSLLESQRGILQSATAEPYAIDGNIVGLPTGAEIDPALSALAGRPVTVAGVPASAANAAPTLGSFVPTANSPNVTDIGRYRTLEPRKTEIAGGVSIARPLSQKVQMTLSGRATVASQESLQGLATADLLLPNGNPWSPFGTDTRLVSYAAAPGALARTSDSWNGRLAAAFNGELVGWRWSLTASHDHDENVVKTDTGLDLSGVQQQLIAGDPAFNPFAVNAINGPMQQSRSTSNSDRSLVEAVANGRILDLPAGGVSTSFKLGLDRRALASSTRRAGLEVDTDLSRTQGNVQASVDIPIASRRNEVLQPLGDLSLNGNISADHFSDFGDLLPWGGGATWRPVEGVQVIGSYTSEEGAPSIQQLGNPLISTPNVRVFDYATGQTVEVTQLDGGNPDLGADHRQTWKIGGRVTPIKGTDFSLQADYVRTSISDPISSMPAATAEIQAAFPDRFLRGPDGQLLLVDNRPVNFERSERSELRWGINFSEKLEASKSEREAMARRRAEFEKMRKEAEASGKPIPNVPAWMQQRPGGASGGPSGGPPSGGAPGGMRGPGGGGMGEGRLQLSLFHTWRFTDTILIRDGVPELDLLNGSATGNTGGAPRHLVEARAAINKNGLGGRVTLNWQSATEVLQTPGGAPSADDLHFSSLATVNLRLFADLGQRWNLTRKAPWVRGMRVSVGVDNLFDKRMDVTDRSGATPLNYQPYLMDPIGRRIEVSVRKLFF